MNCIAVLSLSQAERLISLAASAGVKIEKFHNKQTCRSGCGMTVEVWAHADDMDVIRGIWQKEQQRNFLGLEFDPEQVQQVYDPNQETAVCPACGFQFATTLTECPDCGLCFSP